MKLGCSVLDRLESACLMWAGQVRRMGEEQPAQKAEEEKDSKTRMWKTEDMLQRLHQEKVGEKRLEGAVKNPEPL